MYICVYIYIYIFEKRCSVAGALLLVLCGRCSLALVCMTVATPNPISTAASTSTPISASISNLISQSVAGALWQVLCCRCSVALCSHNNKTVFTKKKIYL